MYRSIAPVMSLNGSDEGNRMVPDRVDALGLPRIQWIHAAWLSDCRAYQKHALDRHYTQR